MHVSAVSFFFFFFYSELLLVEKRGRKRVEHGLTLICAVTAERDSGATLVCPPERLQALGEEERRTEGDNSWGEK